MTTRTEYHSDVVEAGQLALLGVLLVFAWTFF
jgi:hypothetical protein